MYARKIFKAIGFYGFTLLGILCGGFSFWAAVFSLNIPWKDAYHRIDPNFGITWPISWPWVYVMITGLVALVAAINYQVALNRSK
ncbi:MAG: hypothetical protein WCG45_02680 [bacterium]